MADLGEGGRSSPLPRGHTLRSRLAVASALGVLLIGLAACQVVSLITGEDEGAAMRGRQTAEQRCAACHAIGRSGASPRAAAPAFGELNRRFTAPALVRELEASSAVGHYGMPVVATSDAQRADLAAYVASLRRSPAR